MASGVKPSSVSLREATRAGTDMLRGVSENVAHQISGVTNRFGRSWRSHRERCQRALEGATLRIDSTLPEATAEAQRNRCSACRAMPGSSTRSCAHAHARRTRSRRRWLPSSTACEPMPTRRPCGPSRTCARRCRARPHEMTQQLRQEHERLRAEAERLPIVTRESAAKPCGRRSTISCAPSRAALEPERPRAPRRHPPRHPWHPARRCRSRRLTCRAGGRRPAPPPLQAPPRPRRALVARRSAGARLPRRRRHHALALLDIEGIARALDPTTASAILVALPRRPARHHGAQHLHGRG